MAASQRSFAQASQAAADSESSLALSTWVRLLRAEALLLRRVRRFVPEHLTLAQFDVLAQIHRRPEGMTPGALTRELLVTAGNVTGIVDRLVRMGLARRHPVPNDRRAVLVRLSRKGRQIIERAIPRHKQDVQTLLACIETEDLVQLRELLGRVIHVFEAQDRGAAAATAGRRPGATRAGRS